MIMPRGRILHLPASPALIWCSIGVAFLLQMVLSLSLLGRTPWLPDFLVITLMFWVLREPGRVGLTWAFVFGLIMDVQQTSLLGTHALLYTVLCFGMIFLSRRLILFSPLLQAVQMIPFLILSQVAVMAVRMLLGATFPGWLALVSPVGNVICWPFVSALLIWLQRRAERNPENPI